MTPTDHGWMMILTGVLTFFAVVACVFVGMSDLKTKWKVSIGVLCFLVVMALALVAAPGCASIPSGSGKAAGQSASTVSEIGKGVVDSAKNIDAHAKALPDESPERAGITTETGALRIYGQRLLSVGSDITADAKRCAAVEREFEAYKTSDARRILQITMALCVIGCIVAFGLLKNLQLGAVCAVGVALCIGGFWLLAYAKWIALAVVVGMTGLAVYLVWRLIRSSKEISETAKAWKDIAPDAPWEQFAAAAKQSKFTKKIIDVVQPKPKKPKGA